MPDPAQAETTEQQQEQPAVATLENLASYRERRAEVDIAPSDDEPAKVEAKPEPQPDAAAEAEQKDEAEPDPASEAGKALAKKRGSLQARIDEITAASKKRERELLAEIEALRAPKAEPKADAKAESKPEVAAYDGTDPNDPEPAIDKYDDFVKYNRDLARWETRRENRVIKHEEAQAARQHAAHDARGKAIAAAEQAHPDFHEKVAAYESAGGRYSPIAQQIILGDPLGHEFAYVLVTDPEIAARVNGAQDPLAAALEAGAVLAEIRARVAGAKEEKPKPKPVSKAPAPVEVVAGESAASGVPDPAKMSSVSEWRRQRAQFDRAA